MPTFELYLKSGRKVTFEAKSVQRSSDKLTWWHGDSRRRLIDVAVQEIAVLIEIVPDDVSQETPDHP